MTVKELKKAIVNIPNEYEVTSKFPDVHEFSDGVSEVWYDDVGLDDVLVDKDKIILIFS